MPTDVAVLRVLADNPSPVDLLGLSPIAQAVGDIVCADNSEPITVGLHGAWGSGKSTLLQQVATNLTTREATIVLSLNSWEFDDQDDVKAAIINAVLGELAKSAPPGFTERFVGLMKRISWGRAVKAVGRGALTMQWDIDELVDAFTPSAEENNPRNLTGFKTEFAKLMDELPFDRVVLLIDDLDRCLPAAVLSTLEALKLFLAVPKMAFVLAADQAMVREAISVGLGETRRSALFSRDYLDKIVQVPVMVPQPTRHDAECYVAVLLAHRKHGAALDLHEVSVYADERRAAGSLPYAAEAPGGLVPADVLYEAQRIVAGLGSDEVVNPRRMKRFVNALAVRQHTAAASGIDLASDVLAKLFMLEHRFLEHMNELATLSEHERSERLAQWEAWAAGDDDLAPALQDDDLRVFLSGEPTLADKDTARYFVLARKLMSVTFTSDLDENALAVLHALVSGDAKRSSEAADSLATLRKELAEIIVDEMVAQAATAPEPDRILLGLVHAASKGVAVPSAVAAIRGRKDALQAATGHLLGRQTDPLLVQLANELAGDDTVDKWARGAIDKARD